MQGFWSVFNHIPDVSELKLRSYYHLMRDEREPVWEDPALCHGGVWRIKCPKRDTVSLFILEIISGRRRLDHSAIDVLDNFRSVLHKYKSKQDI